MRIAWRILSTGAWALCLPAIGWLVATSPGAFADGVAPPASIDPSLVGVWHRPVHNDSGADTMYLDVAADGSFRMFAGRAAAPEASGLLTLTGGQFHMQYSDNTTEDGALQRIDPNDFRMTDSNGKAAVYTRLVAYRTAPPADMPLMLQMTLPSPRRLLARRCAAEQRLGIVSGPAALLQQAMSFVDQGQAAQAIPILDLLSSDCANDVVFLYVESKAETTIGNINAGRTVLDDLLMQRPDLAEGYLDRALLDGRLGSIPRMTADVAIARALDPTQTAAFESAHQAEMTQYGNEREQRTPAALADSLMSAAKNGSDANALLPIAMALRKAVNLDRRIPQEHYQDGLRLEDSMIAANPNDPQAWADLSHYIYLNAAQKYGVGADNHIEWVNDLLLSMRFARQALLLDPHNVAALANLGWLLEQDNQFKDAVDVAQVGLEIAPGYPRLAELQSEILTGSSILAANKAAQERSRKSGMIVTPAYIFSWSRGPTEGELELAKQFDAMSAANASQANSGMYQAMAQYRNSIDEMNVAARYYQYNGDSDKAVALWNQILQIDADNTDALFGLQDYYNDANQPQQAFEMQLRLDNVYCTTAQPLIDRAMQEISAHDAQGASADLNRALAIDPANSRIYFLFGRLATLQNPSGNFWPWIRCSEALEIAAAEFKGVDLNANTPLSAEQIGALRDVWNGELQTARHDNDAGQAAHYQSLLDGLMRRVSNPLPIGPDTQAALSANFLRTLIADNEMDAAARQILGGGPRSGPWHEEAYNAAADLVYPIYLYLSPRVYPYQLWHYFGPGTLETFDNYAQSHTGIDPNNPPSHGNRPNVAR